MAPPRSFFDGASKCTVRPNITFITAFPNAAYSTAQSGIIHSLVSFFFTIPGTLHPTIMWRVRSGSTMDASRKSKPLCIHIPHVQKKCCIPSSPSDGTRSAHTCSHQLEKRQRQTSPRAPCGAFFFSRHALMTQAHHATLDRLLVGGRDSG